jgi:ribonuclease P/MRP protein subunit POP5
MKLKILPPHLRNPKRYLAFEAISQIPLNREDIISLVLESSLNFCGECETSKFDLWVMKVSNYSPSDGENVVRGILQCNREELDSVRAILAVITMFRGERVVFHTLGIAGTIKSATKKFIKPSR